MNVKISVLIEVPQFSGYEINVRLMARKMRDKTNKGTCLNYIKTNIILQNLNIFIREDALNSEVKWETKQVRLPILESNFDELRDRSRKLLKCPAILDEEKWPGAKYLYILPIYYTIPRKSRRLFIFVESLDDSDTVYPIRLTRVDRAAFQEYDNDDVIGRDKSYGEEIDTQTSSYTTDIPSTSINLMDD